MDVKKIIREKGFTIAQVAKKMGVTDMSLYQTLDGTPNPTVKTLQRIAEVIGCNVGDFFLDELENSSFKNGTLTINGKECDVLLRERK